MKRKFKYTVMVFFVLVVTSCSKESFDQTKIPEAINEVAIERELLDLVNAHRTSMGYDALQYSEVAYEYANKHTDYMISKGGINHDDFSSRASSISSEVNAELVAENVAKDYPNAAEAMQGWLQSPSHKKTMEGEFSHTAVSVKKDAQGNLYYTQLFFRMASQ